MRALATTSLAICLFAAGFACGAAEKRASDVEQAVALEAIRDKIPAPKMGRPLPLPIDRH
jgi:hypothetical protein